MSEQQFESEARRADPNPRITAYDIFSSIALFLMVLMVWAILIGLAVLAISVLGWMSLAGFALLGFAIWVLFEIKDGDRS
jgi:type IV secretory pathway TrbL component